MTLFAADLNRRSGVLSTGLPPPLPSLALSSPSLLDDDVIRTDGGLYEDQLDHDALASRSSDFFFFRRFRFRLRFFALRFLRFPFFFRRGVEALVGPDGDDAALVSASSASPTSFFAIASSEWAAAWMCAARYQRYTVDTHVNTANRSGTASIATWTATTMSAS